MLNVNPAENEARNQRIDSLQVFRGIAALSVLLYHLAGRYWAGGSGLKVPPVFEDEFCGGLFSRGHLGVDFFFVLSGFIIFWVHEKDLGKPERSAHYFLKRFFRIYPVLLAMVLILLLINLMMGRIGDRLETTWESFFSTALLLPDSPYWVGGAWTLCHEVTFYAAFLVGILVGRRVLFLLLGVGVGLIFLIDLTGLHVGLKGMTSCVLSPFNLEFVIGMVVAKWVRSNGVVQINWIAIILSFGVVLMLIWVGDSLLHKGLKSSVCSRLLFGLAFGWLIFLGVMLDLSSKVKWPKIMVVLGDASFSIYLVHVTAISSLKQILSKSSFLMSHPQFMIWCNAVVCFSVCWVFWVLYERPVLKRSNIAIKRWVGV